MGCPGITCIGVLVDEYDGLRHRIWPPKPRLPLSTYLPVSVSLESILTMQCLEKITQPELGVQLASAVMQLHKSGWLCETRGKKDIVFLQKQLKATNGHWFPVPEVERPFVRRMFPPPHVSSNGDGCYTSTSANTSVSSIRQ